MTMCPILKILTLTPYRQTFRPIIKMYTKDVILVRVEFGEISKLEEKRVTALRSTFELECCFIVFSLILFRGQ